MHSLAFAFLLMLIAGPLLAAERQGPFLDALQPATPPARDTDGESATKDGAPTLPPWPKDSDLVELHLDDSSPSFRHYIDGKYISVGSDGVVRYTLVSDSQGGARNISFEGLRCTPNGELKIYAYGNNGRFERNLTEWQPIHGGRSNQVHRQLHRQILCVPLKFEPRPKKDMIRAMRTRVPQEANTGFLPD